MTTQYAHVICRKRLEVSQREAAEAATVHAREKKETLAQLEKDRATSLVWQQSSEKSTAALEAAKKHVSSALQVCDVCLHEYVWQRLAGVRCVFA